MARTAAVQTPGEPTNQPTGAADPGAEAGGDVELSEVDALRAALAAQKAQMDSMMTAMAHLQRSVAGPKPKNSDDDLPDLRTMDLEALNNGDTPVLTKQGWIVPPTYGADPEKLAEDRAKAEDRKLLHALVAKVKG